MSSDGSRARRLATARVVAIVSALVGGRLPALAADGDLTPYDAGYAYHASRTCPDVQLLVAISPEMQASAQFQSGVDMFAAYLKAPGPEWACKAALNLYDAKTGKVAKLLGRK